MKKKYFKPAIEIAGFAAEDILTTSILSDLFGDGGSSAGSDEGIVSEWSSESEIRVAGD